MLTVLHNNDGESDLLPNERTVDGQTFEYSGIARFGAVVDRLRAEAANALLVSSGDNFLAGPVLDASRAGGTFFDAVALDLLDYDASAIGNHEFDFGPGFLASFIQAFRGDASVDDDGAPPFVSANLDVSGEAALQALVDDGVIRPSTVVVVGGRRVGLVGATTTALATISSPGNVEVLQNVAERVQAEIDALQADGVGIIGLISHLQSVNNDRELVAQLSGLDFAVAGGGDELLANDDDALIPGDEAIRSADAYPILSATLSGDIPLVTTVGGYDYVGRLVLTFDAAGTVTAISDESGPVRVVSTAFADGVEPDAELLAEVERPVAELIGQLQTIVATTEVTLDGTRQLVRTRETNYGSLIADALLDAADDRNEAAGAARPVVAIQNSGGIRNSIVLEAGSGISEFEVGQTLPFGNRVAIVEDVTPAQLKAVLENAVSRVENVNGRFAQVAGLSFVYDPAGQPRRVDASGAVTQQGRRVQRVVLDDGTVIVDGGAVVDGAPAIAVATVDFLVTPRDNGLGGDEYPFVVDGNPFTVLDVDYKDALLAFLRDDLAGVVPAAGYPEGGEGRVLTVLTPASPVAFADGFDADGQGDARGEVVALTNTGTAPVSVSLGTFVVIDPFSERVTFAATPTGTLGAGETFTFASTGGDLDLPAGVIPDGPGAFAFVAGRARAGDSVGDLLADGVVAAVVYLAEDDVFGQVGGGSPEANAQAFLAGLAAVVGGVAAEDGPGVDLDVVSAPNPTAGAATVSFGLAAPGEARVALYDALGRQVAVLADGAFEAGRHAVALDGGALPSGVYVVRVETGGVPQTARLTVVR